MGDFKEKKIQSGFPTLSCFTRSGVRTICDLPPPVPSLEALFALFWQVLESAYADLNSNIKILGQYVLKPLILVYCNSNIVFWANSIVL